MDTTETSAGGFATTLRRRRLVARLSQERLAELSGLSARAIRDIERGRVARPRPESVRLIGLALGLAGAELAEFRRLAEEDYWADREPGPVPRPAVAQLPAAVAGFTGRKDDLDQLDRLLVDPRDPAGGGRIVLVSGAPGVGKTALAVQWAHQAAGWFPDGQLYVDLRGYDPDQPVAAADALAGFLRALGLAGDAIPYDLAERAAAYRTALSGRRLLVVLDNALASDQVRPLLPGSGSCPVLVTSRDSLPGLVARHGAHRLELDLLPEADAVDLVRVLVGDRAEAEPAAVRRLAEHCGRLPLALRVAAEGVLDRAAGTLTEVVAELADGPARSDLLAAGDDPRTSVESVFSWSYQRLPAGPARTFRLLAEHPGPDADLHDVAALTGADLRETRRTLAELGHAHLVESARPGVWSLHDLLRAYAADRPEAGPGERAAALGRLLDHHLAVAAAAADVLHPAERHRRPEVPAAPGPLPPLPDPAAARDRLDARLAALTAAAAVAGAARPDHAVRLAGVLDRYLLTGGHRAEGLALHTLALQSAVARGDLAAEARATMGVGTTEVQWGRIEDGARTIQRAVELAARVGETAVQARGLTNLGIALRLVGRPDEAAERFEAAIALHRRRGDLTGEARLLTNLGSLLSDRGRFAAAIEHFERSLAVFTDAGNSTGQAEASNDLGMALRSVGRLADAERAHRRSLELFRAAGAGFGEGWALAGLGDVYLDRGEPDRADEPLAQALALFRSFGLLDSQAWVLESTAIGHRLRGRFEEAVGDHEQALELARQTGWRHVQARCLNGHGDTLRAAGRPAEAADRYAAALAEATAIGNPYEELRAQRGLAAVHAAAGAAGPAAAARDRAAALAAEMGLPAGGDLV